MLEIAYGLITDKMTTEQRDALDESLRKLDDPGAGRVVKMVQNAYGKMVPVSQERLDEILSRNARLSQIAANR